MDAVEETRRWVQQVVVGLNLCPFAAQPMADDTVRFALSRGADLPEVLAEVLGEAQQMQAPGGPRTTLLVIPDHFRAFEDLLDAAAIAEAVLADHGLGFALQLIAFHPDWRPEGAAPDDPANATNRSPYPTLHLLRNADVELAERTHPDVAGIPARNAALLRRLAAATPGDPEP